MLSKLGKTFTFEIEICLIIYINSEECVDKASHPSLDCGYCSTGCKEIGPVTNCLTTCPVSPTTVLMFLDRFMFDSSALHSLRQYRPHAMKSVMLKAVVLSARRRGAAAANASVVCRLCVWLKLCFALRVASARIRVKS